MNAPDGRRIFLWQGQNLIEDTSRLVNAVAQAAVTELFNVNRGLIWLDAGKPVPVHKNALREVITRHIVSVRLVSRGEFGLEREFYSFSFPLVADLRHEPNERILIDMIPILAERVAKGPQEPLTLSEGRVQEVRTRLNTGEPPSRIADAYGVDVDTIKRVAR